jgi:hypothetical protein
MKDFRMGDFPWNLSGNDMRELYPELEPEQRVEAAENLSRYFKVVGKIHDHLDDQGKLKDTLLRIQYEKRNRKDTESQNVNQQTDDTATTTGDLNESNS